MLGLFRSRTVSKLQVSPPVAHADRSGLAIAVILRGEAKHIAEWAKFHVLAGVSHFIAYDNGPGDGTVDALIAAVGHDQVTVIPWDQRLTDARSGAELHNQALSFAHAIRNFGGRFRWLAFIDPDEFIIPRMDDTVPEVLNGLGDFGCLSLPWAMFGRCGHDTPPQGGMLPNYLLRNRDPLTTPRVLKFKCIVDACRVTAVQVHEFEIDGSGEGFNDQGQLARHTARATAQFVSSSALQLNHYYTRSDAELRAKIARGSNKTVEQAKHAARVWRNVEMIETDVIEDRTALDFLSRRGLTSL